MKVIMISSAADKKCLENLTHPGTVGKTILSKPKGELTGVPPRLFDCGDELALDALSCAFKATRAR